MIFFSAFAASSPILAWFGVMLVIIGLEVSQYTLSLSTPMTARESGMFMSAISAASTIRVAQMSCGAITAAGFSARMPLWGERLV